MKVLVQRVSRAAVRVGGREVSRIGPGLLVLLGVERGDHDELADWYAERLSRLRLFAGDEGAPWQQSVRDTGGSVLVVSQFTLPARTRKGRRPSFDRAAPPETAELLYRRFLGRLVQLGVPAAGGSFGEMMEVELVNDGPVTFLLDGPSPSEPGP